MQIFTRAYSTKLYYKYQNITYDGIFSSFIFSSYMENIPQHKMRTFFHPNSHTTSREIRVLFRTSEVKTRNHDQASAISQCQHQARTWQKTTMSKQIMATSAQNKGRRLHAQTWKIWSKSGFTPAQWNANPTSIKSKSNDNNKGTTKLSQFWSINKYKSIKCNLLFQQDKWKTTKTKKGKSEDKNNNKTQ